MFSRSRSDQDRAAEAGRELLRRWQPCPGTFAREALAFDLWSKQREIAAAIAKPRAKVAVRSGHKVGKTDLAATICHWFAQTHQNARAVFTGPTHANLQNVIWPALRRRYEEAPISLGGRMYDDLRRGIVLPGNRQILGLTVKDPEAFQGISGELLFVVDEASGVSDAVFNAIFGNTAGGVRVLLISNPTRPAGTLYDAFHTKRDAWVTFRIDSRWTPNFDPNLPNIPHLAEPEWLEWAAKQYGVGTAQWNIRVEGQYPRQGNQNVVSLGAVEDAKARGDELLLDYPPSGAPPTTEQLDYLARCRAIGAPLRIGVDVGRFGDDPSVIAALRGDVLVALSAHYGLDGPDLAGRVIQLVGRLRGPQEPPPQVNVDVIGVGSSCVDQLRRLPDKCACVPVNVATSPTSQPAHGPGYGTLRDQLWFGVEDFLSDGGVLPPRGLEDLGKLETELVAPEYRFGVRNEYRVTPKDVLKQELGRSCDFADALCLAAYQAPATMDAGTLKRSETRAKRDRRRMGGY